MITAENPLRELKIPKHMLIPKAVATDLDERLVTLGREKYTAEQLIAIKRHRNFGLHRISW